MFLEVGKNKMKKKQALSDLVYGLPLARDGKHCSWSCLCSWRATADLVRGCVSVCVSAGPLALSRWTVILGCMLSGFDWTSRYQRASSKMITTQGVTTASRHLFAVTVHVTLVYRYHHTLFSCATSATYGGLRDWLAQIRHGLYSLRCERCLLITESPKTPYHYRYQI